MEAPTFHRSEDGVLHSIPRLGTVLEEIPIIDKIP